MLRPLILVGVTMAMINGCGKNQRQTQSREGDNRRISDAVVIVRRFVGADVSGSPDSAWVLLRGCEVLPVADGLQPSAGTQVLDSVARGDTVRVRVVYKILGRATSADVRTAGERNWRFVSGVRQDTLAFAVVPDSAGRLWIECGYFPPIHKAANLMSEVVSHMDQASRASWNSALAAAERLR